MSGPQVEEIVPDKPESIMSSDIADEIVSQVSPSREGDAPADPPEKKEKPAPKPEGKDEPPQAKPGELTPDDLGDDPPPAPKPGDDIPSDLLPEQEIEKHFRQDPKQKDAFVKERAYNKQLRQQVEEANAKVAALQAKAQDAEQVAELKDKIQKAEARAAALETELGRLDLTKSPEFRKKYVDPINSVATKIANALVTEGTEPEQAKTFVRQLMNEKRPSARERLIDDMAPGLKGTILSYMTRVEEVVGQRELALQNWKETSAALQDADARSRLVAATEKIDETVATAVSEMRTLGNPFYMETSKEEWNRGVQARVEKLKGILLTGDVKQLAVAVAEGLTAADFRARFIRARDEAKALKQQLEDATRGAPSFRGRSPTLPGSTPPAEKPITEQPVEDQVTDLLRPGAR